MTPASHHGTERAGNPGSNPGGRTKPGPNLVRDEQNFWGSGSDLNLKGGELVAHRITWTRGLALQPGTILLGSTTCPAHAILSDRCARIRGESATQGYCLPVSCRSQSQKKDLKIKDAHILTPTISFSLFLHNTVPNLLRILALQRVIVLSCRNQAASLCGPRGVLRQESQRRLSFQP